MRIIDSNIIIYSIELPYSYLRAMVKNPAHYVAAVSRVEVLGFPLTPKEEVYFESILQLYKIYP